MKVGSCLGFFMSKTGDEFEQKGENFYPFTLYMIIVCWVADVENKDFACKKNDQ